MLSDAESKIREAIDIAVQHQREGRLRAAGNIYRRVLRIDPNNPDALHFLGVIAHKVERPDLAVELLKRSISADPKRFGFRLNLGSLYLKLQRVEEAIACYREAIALEPQSAAGHAHLAGALARQGKLEEANHAFARAFELKSPQAVSPPKPSVPAVPDPVARTSGELDPAQTVWQRTISVPAAPHSVAAVSPSPGTPGEGRGEGLSSRGKDLLLNPLTEYGKRDQERNGSEPVELSADAAEGIPASAIWSESAPHPPHPPVQPEATPTALPELSPTPANEKPAPIDPPGVDASSHAARSALELQVTWALPLGPGHQVPSPIEPPPGLDDEPSPQAAELFALPKDGEGDELEDEDVVVDSADSAEAEEAEESFELDDDSPLIDSLGSVSLANELADGCATEPPGPSGDASQSEPNERSADALDADLLEMPVASVEPGPLDSDIAILTNESPAAKSASGEQANIDRDAIQHDPAADHIGASAVAAERQLEPGLVNGSEPLSEEVRPGLLGEAHDEILQGRFESPDESKKRLAVPAIDRSAETLPLPGTPVARSVRGPESAPGRSRPPSAESLRRRGVILMGARRLDEAVDLLNQAVSLRPKFAEAHRDLGGAMLRRGDLNGAIASLQRALQLRPKFAEAWGSLGDAYQLEGKIGQAIRCYRRLLNLVPRAAKVHSNMLLSMNYDPRFSASEVYVEHLRWAERHAESLAREIKPHDNDRSPHRKLMIGYVSPDFRRHSVNYFAEPVLAGHYRRDFHVTCYSDVIRPDGVTRGLADISDRFRDTHAMNDEQLTEQIRADRIDILVDLSGHTGNNRLGTFARKPAPVQVSYLGYPNTTGLSTIDYRVTDALADPPGETERFHSEHLVRLPETFLCYQPPQPSPDVGPLPCLKAGYVTFGCFNILAKITDEVMALWARILQALPNSRLVLKGRSGALSNEERRRHIRDIFVNHGILADRLELLGKEPNYAQHLTHYRRLDIVLDPFPYNGTTTTCEALWMGLPVITLEGDRHVSRVGVSILNNVGLPELIADTPEHYVQIATSLAGSPKGLSRLRSNLREWMMCSPLTDSIRLARALEAEYRKMWLHWCQSTRSTPAPRDSLTLTDG